MNCMALNLRFLDSKERHLKSVRLIRCCSTVHRLEPFPDSRRPMAPELLGLWWDNRHSHPMMLLDHYLPRRSLAPRSLVSKDRSWSLNQHRLMGTSLMPKLTDTGFSRKNRMCNRRLEAFPNSTLCPLSLEFHHG